MIRITTDSIRLEKQLDNVILTDYSSSCTDQNQIEFDIEKLNQVLYVLGSLKKSLMVGVEIIHKKGYSEKA